MRNNRRLKVAIGILLSVTFICVAGVTILFCILLLEPEMGSAELDRSRLEAYLGIIVYAASFLGVGITLNSFAFQSLVREKARGNLQSLLATPVKPKDIWMGKSLSILVPGTLFGSILAMLVLVVVNAVYFLPDIGFVLNPWIALSSFVGVPLVYLALGLLVHLVGLTSRAANGNVIAQLFLPVMVNVMIQVAVHDVVDAGSWLFLAMNLGLAAVIGAIVIGLRSRLTTERIIFSN
ncbi:MAG TPA: ABC transporter permease subunit [Candidatus Bipolaricaulis sp.]|nr:ABC transporter permease subunit [Candidatus Bipolaricaulis sp.]HRS14084.1 ABC transporter permease subunit [Candidatus Bipolaricaulis sp.]HRU21843.1 ABC transporter permease subunit [Candidatus Bipolaricaulis sp.]